MKLRATVLLFAAFCFLVTSPAWAASICDSTPGNLVTNCGFETGDFTGWTFTGNTSFSGVSPFAPYVNSGLFGAQMGPFGSDGFLSQTVLYNTWTFAFRQDPSYWGLDDFVVTKVGTCGPSCVLFDASFYLYNDGGVPNDFTVFFNGVDVGPDLVNAGGFPYTDYVGFGFQGTTPEPGTMMLFGTGIIGLAGVIRRKLSL